MNNSLPRAKPRGIMNNEGSPPRA